MTRTYLRYTDAELRAAYRALDTQRVKTGRNKGQIKMRALKEERRMVAEAAARGAEYPHTWLNRTPVEG